MIPMRAFRAALAMGAALALSGCISLFPKSDPVQTYRFDAPTPSPRVAAPDGQRVGVLKPGVVFPRAAGVDRILTVDGEKTAYSADSR